MRRLILLFFFLFPVSLFGEDSPWRVEFHPRFGLYLGYDGVPVIRRSTLAVVSPGWNPVLFHQAELVSEVEAVSGTAGPGVFVRTENEYFVGEQRFEAVSEERFRILFEGKLKQDVPARIELAAGYFNANLISGVPYRGETKKGLKAGIVPVYPAGTDQQANDLLPHFRWVEFQSRIGRLRIDVDAGDERVMFFDARRDPQPWAEPAPVFWMGIGSPAPEIRFGEKVRFEVVISVERGEELELEEVAAAPVQVVRRDVFSPKERPVLVIPTPKEAEVSGRFFSVPFKPEIRVARNGRDSGLAEHLLELLGRFGISVGEVEERVDGRSEVLIGRPELSEFSEEEEWFVNEEGYRLISDENGIGITASTEAGVFYGMQTLAQLLRPSGEGALYAEARIFDWPSMRFRGAHWFPSASGAPFHEKLIERVLGHFKMNHTVIQCEAAVWESHPEIAGPNSISKEGLRHLVEVSRKNFVEPIPLVNVPGHAEWIFRNGNNLHFSEGPGNRYAYCVNHPESFPFIQDILSEAIEVFEPEWFHLGHDEADMHSTFPHPECERCAGETTTELFLRHLHRLSDWLGERGIEPMVWGDMMLSREEVPDTAAFARSAEEAVFRRANLPKRAIVTDWHYYDGKEYPSLGYFHKEGHRTIASTWYVRKNIHHFAQAALEQNSLGLLQTTWAGYFPDERVLKDAIQQFDAFVLAAEYAWSGNPLPPSELSFEVGKVFQDAYFRSGDRELGGRLVDLSGIGKTSRREWLGVESDWNLEELGRGEVRFGGMAFLVPEKFVVVGGRIAPPTAVRRAIVETGAKAKEIALLNTALFHAPQDSVPVRMRVLYSDGRDAEVRLMQGRETHHWGTGASAHSAAIAWESVSPLGTPVVLRMTLWENPNPEKIIERIIFEAESEEQAWVLAGLTLVTE